MLVELAIRQVIFVEVGSLSPSSNSLCSAVAVLCIVP
jgi:hypothetical protein